MCAPEDRSFTVDVKFETLGFEAPIGDALELAPLFESSDSGGGGGGGVLRRFIPIDAVWFLILQYFEGSTY